ncbi:hypothetical protein BH09ACT1_BH09ACT1_16410 [soil metagenome]
MKKFTMSFAAAAILLTTAITLSGCTGGVTPGPTKSHVASAGEGRVLTNAEAKKLLPTAAQVGDDWTVADDSAFASSDVLSSATFTPANCAFSSNDGTLKDVPITTQTASGTAEGQYNLASSSKDAPSLDVHLVTVSVKSYPASVDTKQLDAVSARLAECSTFTAGESGGINAKFAVQDVSNPAYGTKSLQFGLKGSISVFSVLVNSLQIVDGHTVVSISQVGVDSIDEALAARVAKAVTANLVTVTK